MSPIGDLARQDEYDDLARAPFGVGSPGESAGAPSLVGWLGRLLAPAPRDPVSPVRYRTSSPLVNITEQDIGDATSKALDWTGGGLATKGIRAYHSSPHDFERFDLSKIGTGEGAQAYGHGLYFAENPVVSGQGGQYWQQFLPRFEGPEAHAAMLLDAQKFDRAAATERLAKHIETLKDISVRDPYLEQSLELLKSGKPVGPRTYEVDINADPAHFLDWDKGLHTQSPEVRRALERQLGIKADPALMRAHDDALYAALTGDPNIKIPNPLPDPTGAEIYRNKIGPATVATRQLSEAGIPGIKYLDEGSRIIPGQVSNAPQSMRDAAKVDLARWETKQPTSNYVVFNPGIIDIMRKYGIAGAAPVGMGALAAQDNYQP